MANMRQAKKRLMQLLSGENWQEHLEEIAEGGTGNTGALFSLLSREPELMHRAARALGKTVARIWKVNPEVARDIVRRFMWHMNEESGNIGWGIPAAFAETMVACPDLAKSFGQILNTYIMDLGFDDNYCDHDALRRTCYWAIGRMAQADAQLALKAKPWLVKGLDDRDSICRGMAAWALAQMPPDLTTMPALRQLADAHNEDECEIFEGDKLETESVSALAKEALLRLDKSLTQ